MTIFQKLKHEARRAEQRSDWARAIELYRQALDSDEDMADLSLYNRIGDLYLRLGKNEAAVECYEQAVDRYADHGMLTSAIALCNKILRIAPGRTSVYRRLGGLHARTGLVVEGRSNTLNFARHALEEGKPLDAARAIDEFAELTGDTEVRLRFADALEAAGEAAPAVEQLRAVLRLRRQRGDDDTELAARIEALAPGSGAGEQEPEPEIADGAPAAERPAGPVRLARLVAAELAADETGSFEPEAPAPEDEPARAPDDGLDGVRRELGRFRAGISDVLDGGDLTVRYDLGVEFMTIGLLDEAIEEFQHAVADPALVEAANARIGECLALRTSGSTFEMVRRVPVAAAGARARASEENPAAPTSNDGPEPIEDEQPVEEGQPVGDAEPAGEAPNTVPADSDSASAEARDGSDEAAPEAPDAAAAEAEETPEAPATAAGPLHEPPDEDELQGHFFRARLAQYRIRRAEERHTVDHAAHLDLGSSYVGMDLFQEAYRELSVALEGPRPVSGRAARALEALALEPGAPPDLALRVLELLAASDHSKRAESLGGRLAEAWGETHPEAPRLGELRDVLSDAVDTLPALEDMFPAMGGEPQSGAEPAPESGEAAGGVEAGPENEEAPDDGEGIVEIAEAEELAELDEMLAELDQPAGETSDARAPAGDESVGEVLAAADELVGSGEVDAAVERLHATFGQLGEAGRTREALTVLDRLIELEPDEEVLHHQRTELAEMANDRDRLLAAWAALGACLRRKGDDRRARAAYGRMLDIDPEHESARQTIATIDADELERERGAARRHERAQPKPTTSVSAEDAAELEALLEELEGDEEVGEAVGIADEKPREAPAGRSDGANGDGGGLDDAMTRSRYELGLAFRQMGMWDEAVRELRPALDGVEDRLTALEALGECLLKSGHAGEAIELLQKNLRADEDAEQVGPLYFLGLALQVEGETDTARDVFGRVEAVQPGYRDTADRLSELSL